jgi:phenylacetic acid degradation operon negative regulatory protein
VPHASSPAASTPAEEPVTGSTPAAEPHLGTGRQLQQFIVTICALYARGERSIAVADLIRLLETLHVEESAARSALSRLKKRGILLSTRVNGGAAYRLDPALEAVFQEGDERIFATRRATPDERWLLVAFSVPESRRHLRHQIRKVLASRGFGTVAAGLWIAPESGYAHVRRELEREGLAEFVEFFSADVITDEVGSRVAQWWDLDALAELYAGFRASFEPVLDRWQQRGASGEDPQAFADHVLLLTAWRRLPYLDPGLPSEYLPPDWEGLAAERLFMALHGLLAPAAARHAATVLGS